MPKDEWLQFYEIQSVQRYTENANAEGILAQYNFSQAAVYQQYERTVYNIFDVLSTLGGLFSSLNVIGLIFTRIFSYNLMLSSIIRKLYHFKPKFEKEVKVKKKKTKGKKKRSAVDELAE